MNNPKILEKIRAYKELQIFIKQLEEEAEAHKQAIIEEMNAQHTDSMTIDIFSVKYSSYQSSRVDTTALKKELPDIAERFTKITEAKRFSVS